MVGCWTAPTPPGQGGHPSPFPHPVPATGTTPGCLWTLQLRKSLQRPRPLIYTVLLLSLLNSSPASTAEPIFLPGISLLAKERQEMLHFCLSLSRRRACFGAGVLQVINPSPGWEPLAFDLPSDRVIYCRRQMDIFQELFSKGFFPHFGVFVGHCRSPHGSPVSYP